MTQQPSPASIVSIVKAKTYSIDVIRPALEKSLDLIGGLKGIVKPGAKVFVKINHLSPPSPAERGIVTHPVFTEAFLGLLKDTGAAITVGDDVEADSGIDGFEMSGYRQMCNRLGLKLVNLREAGFVTRKSNGILLKEIYLSRATLESDVIINLPKFKTHSLTLFTGAIKNMYGVIPVGLRRTFHGEYFRVEDFCNMLVDIFAEVKPHLTIMDGIIAMEGEGPGSGRLKNLGLILASRDAVALDAIAGHIIGLTPDRVLPTRFAAERGLGIADFSRIQVVGESVGSVAVSDFKLPAAISRLAVERAPRSLANFAISQVTPQPYVNSKTCTACGECVKVCPVFAATLAGDSVEINHAKCIRCMCCHEVCRQGAIVPRRPFFGNLIYSTVKAVRKVIRV